MRARRGYQREFIYNRCYLSAIRVKRSVKPLKFSSEGLVQQRLLQRLQRGVLPLVEAGEALGFFCEVVELFHDATLIFLVRQ